MTAVRTKFGLIAVCAVLALTLAACGGGGGEANEISVTGQDTFQFSPEALTTTVGQPTNVTLVNTGALEHSFVLDEVSVKIGPLPGGESDSASFTPNAAGTYTFYCDIAGHREAGMEGTLTVNP